MVKVTVDKRSIIVVVLALAILGVSFLLADTDLGLTGFLVKGKADLTVNIVDGSNNHAIRDARVYVQNIEKDDNPFYAGRTRRDGERTVRLSEGTYRIEITARNYDSEVFSILLKDGDERNVNIVLFPEDYEEVCSDGTLINTCSAPQPLFCNSDKKLVERCDLCSCPQGKTCSFDGSCR